MSVLHRIFGSRNPPTLWAFFLAVGMVYLYSLTQLSAQSAQGYWTGVVSSATVFTVFSCGFSAVMASVEGSRVRRARVQELAPVRDPLRVAIRGVLPIVGLAVVLQLLGLVLTAYDTWGAPGSFPVVVPLTWLTMAVFHAIAGYLIGLYVPFAAAAPIALVVSYVWLGFTWSVSFVPLRYLSGLALSGCCEPSATLAPAAPWATIVFNVFGIAAAVLVLGQRGRTSRRSAWVHLLPIPVVVSGAIIGLLIAAGLGPYPSPERSSADLVCTKAGPSRLCLYPEQTWRATIDPAKTVTGALHVLQSAGFDVPTLITGQPNQGDQARTTVSIAYRRDFDADATLASLTSALTQPELVPACQYEVHENTPTGAALNELAAAVLYVHAGGNVEYSPGRAMVEKARALLALPLSEQTAWVREVITAAHTCGTVPAPPVG